MQPGDLVPTLADALEREVGDAVAGCYALPGPGRFLVVTRSRAEGPVEAGVRAVHHRLADGDRLDGSYAPAADLRSPMSVGRAWLRASPGSRELLASAHDNTAHDRWLLLHESRAVSGPAPASVVHEVGADVLRAEALGTARARAELIEVHPELLDDPAGREELVATLCRLLHTAYVGRVASPDVALTWAADVVAVPLGERADPAAVRAFVWEAHRLVGAEVVRRT